MKGSLNDFAKSVGLREVRTDSSGVNIDDIEYARAVIDVERVYQKAVQVGEKTK